MNEIFSSREFEAKFDLSRKFKVEIDNDEKNGCVGREDGFGRFTACRLIKEESKATSSLQ